VQLTECAVLVDVDDEFSWSRDFNRRVCWGDPNPMPFFFSLFFLFIMCFVLINYWEQRLRAALAMVKKEPHISKLYFKSDPQ